MKTLFVGLDTVSDHIFTKEIIMLGMLMSQNRITNSDGNWTKQKLECSYRMKLTVMPTADIKSQDITRQVHVYVGIE